MAKTMKRQTITTTQQPSLAGCVLHVRAVFRKPSAFRFYAAGLWRELDTWQGGLCLACFVFLLFAFGVNAFFQS